MSIPKDCLAKSLNVPSVKLLNYVGIDKAKDFANKFNINFDESDNGHSLALGGMTKGLNFKTLTNCYQCFANGGNYIPISFVKEIRTEDDKILYKHNETGKQVIKSSTAYLLSDMLKESVKSGTCKKLNLGKYDICAKTGTVGVANNENNENSDVWSLSYTPQNTLCVWLGSTNNKNCLPSSITGSGVPSTMAQNFYKKVSLSKEKFDRPNSVIEQEINYLEYKNNQKLLLCSENTPDRYKTKGLFAIDNQPKEISNMFENIDDFKINVKKISENQVEIFFDAKNYLKYEIIRKDDDNKKVLSIIENKNETINFIDSDLKKGNLYVYFVEAKLIKENLTKTSNEIKILLV